MNRGRAFGWSISRRKRPTVTKLWSFKVLGWWADLFVKIGNSGKIRKFYGTSEMARIPRAERVGCVSNMRAAQLVPRVLARGHLVDGLPRASSVSTNISCCLSLRMSAARPCLVRCSPARPSPPAAPFPGPNISIMRTPETMKIPKFSC